MQTEDIGYRLLTKSKGSEVISLCELEKNSQATIVTLNTQTKATKRLIDLGLTPNTLFRVLRKGLGCGPIEIQIRGAKLILGRGIAAKIFVKRQ